MFRQRAVFLAVIFLSALAATRIQAQTVIVDQGLGTQVGSLPNPIDSTNPLRIPGGALLTVDNNGNRTLLSDFGNASQGPIGGGQLETIAWVPSGLLGLGHTILALDASAGTNHAGALFAVDPSSGNRTILNDFGDSTQGQLGVDPVGLVVANGLAGLGTAIYVLDSSAGTNSSGAIFRIDTATGNRTVLTDFGSTMQGPLGTNPISIAIAPAGLLGLGAELLVLDNGAGTNGIGAVFAVDNSGNRTLFSDLGNSAQGQMGAGPQKVTAVSGLLGLGTEIYVTDSQAGANKSGAVLLIAANGNRTMVSDFGKSAQGALGDDPYGIAPDSTGKLLVVDDFLGSNPTKAKLFSITPVTGQRTVVTDCSNTAQGPCQQPVAVIDIP